MKFATFQSTYKPLPIETYERTGQELEAKYYKNREDSSQLRQYMSKLQVEDRNIGHLAKATTDVENMFDQIDGKWHRAGNILFNAKERIIQDKALNASIEDYAKSQAQKAEQQKRFEEGKIDQAALNAYYINDKRYNDKAIEIDENGQAKNRWSTPTPISKVDIEKKVTDLVQLLNQHKDSLPVGATSKGSPLYEVYQANPRLEGYVTKYTASGKSPEKIAEAVRAWIDTTPEVKQYYNYINDATVFDAVTEKDENGKYLKDENGNFIQRDLTAKDFRDIGVSVADDWNTISNFTTVALPGGILTQIPVENQSDNLKNTGLYKELIESGLSDKEAMQKIYANTLTSMQTDKIINFGRQFAYNELDSEVLKDERHWFDLNLAKEKEKNKDIFNIIPNVTTNVRIPDYDALQTESLITDLINRRNSVSGKRNQKEIDEFNQYDYEIKNLVQREKLLRSAFINSPEGATYIEDTYNKILKKAKRSDRENIKQHKQDIIDYISGLKPEIGFNVPNYLNKPNKDYDESQSSTGGYMFKSYVPPNNTVGNAKKGFSKALTNSLQKKGIEISYNTGILADRNGLPAKVMEAVNDFSQKNATEFTIVNQESKNKNRRETLAQIIDNDLKDKNVNLYDFNIEVPTGKDNIDNFFLRITPKTKDTPPLQRDSFIIKPNPTIRNEFIQTLGKIGIDNDADGIAGNWGRQLQANSIYGDQFEQIENDLRRALELDSSVTLYDLGEQYITNIPSRGKYYNFKIIPNSDNRLDVYQLDSNGSIVGDPKLRTFRLSDIKDYFTDLIFKQ